jgi:hypothetical protein
MQVHFRLLETSPGFRERQAELEQATAQRMSRGRVAREAQTVTVPVVVHVVYREEGENVSTAQVKSQIAALNRDFRAKNADKSKVPEVWKGMVADARVEFKLARKDPSGKATSGITRTRTTDASFSDDDSVKSSSTGGVDSWPANTYLNIWVCTLSDGLLGYAQFPGGPRPTDGVVILNSAFGSAGTATAPFDLGRTATHEVGHWLNLRHIWGDTEDCTGSDMVSDTPNAAGPNFGKPTFPRVTCGNGPNGDMFMNYMDYVDDDSMLMFTPQQVVRMRAAIDGPRQGVKS